MRPPGQARTRLARNAVVQATRTLFLERGYGSTTIEAISALADVPAATVYRLFSSKHGILKALLDVSIVGDDKAVALADRPHVTGLLADPDYSKGVPLARLVDPGMVAAMSETVLANVLDWHRRHN